MAFVVSRLIQNNRPTRPIGFLKFDDVASTDVVARCTSDAPGNFKIFLSLSSQLVNLFAFFDLIIVMFKISKLATR